MEITTAGAAVIKCPKVTKERLGGRDNAGDETTPLTTPHWCIPHFFFLHHEP